MNKHSEEPVVNSHSLDPSRWSKIICSFTDISRKKKNPRITSVFVLCIMISGLLAEVWLFLGLT